MYIIHKGAVWLQPCKALVISVLYLTSQPDTQGLFLSLDTCHFWPFLTAHTFHLLALKKESASSLLTQALKYGKADEQYITSEWYCSDKFTVILLIHFFLKPLRQKTF